MQATIIGGGRIGRGFISSLLQRNNVKKIFFDTSEKLINEFNSIEKYTVHILGNEKHNTIISDFKGALISDQQKLRAEMEETDFIFTAVGGGNLKSLGKNIGQQYKVILENQSIPSFTIITCENWLTPAEDLRSSILEELDEEQKEIFKKNVDITQAVIRASGTSAPKGKETDNPLDTWMQDYWILPIDKSKILNNPIPDWKYFVFDDDFGAMLPQKIYTNNTSVALVSYLGYLKGLQHVAEAANDKEIEPIFKEGFNEINNGLIYGLGINEKSQEKFSKIAEKKYKDYSIVDDIVRISRDPLRKLRPDDRLIGPAKLAQKVGVEPKAISLAIAAAIYFDYKNDTEAMKLQKMRKEHGIEYILDNVCGLEENEDLKTLIFKSIEQLKLKEWIKEGDNND